MTYRIGHGFDAHRFGTGDRLMLGGVEIKCGMALEGHSDADVALHALCDALLGAVALGDIGLLFPDNSALYKDISSLVLLDRVMDKIGTAGYKVGNIDLTITAQTPKLAPYYDSMRSVIAKSLQVDISSVSVKATTTEGMGFIGRNEGIAVWAVALVIAKTGDKC